MSGQGDPHELISEFGRRLRAATPTVGLYVAGSVATGDYRSGVSDIDLVAIIRTDLAGGSRRTLRRLHRDLAGEHRAAAVLGCTYVAEHEVAAVGRPHPTWSHGVLFRRPLTGVVRAELLRHGQVVFGPPAADLLPGVTDAELRAAVRGELSGFWSRAVRRRAWWLQDEHVDLALLTMARADTTLRDGALITKSEALDRLAGIGVPADLAEEVRSRRNGRQVRVGPGHRLRRAGVARDVTARAIARH